MARGVKFAEITLRRGPCCGGSVWIIGLTPTIVWPAVSVILSRRPMPSRSELNRRAWPRTARASSYRAMDQNDSPPGRSWYQTGASFRRMLHAACGSPSTNMSRSQKSISSNVVGNRATVYPPMHESRPIVATPDPTASPPRDARPCGTVPLYHSVHGEGRPPPEDLGQSLRLAEGCE